ncbi:hypothetical protein P8C59_006316 [Phyllachora maydis]|uniref:Uncharacterized protein n=1 Tax=Phyllachora maydis TaxID=1825666 RepID=A0AAD9I671_9PEZI|nr:hypothetical protein P8C59_006316 [Phyllachora maydis]
MSKTSDPRHFFETDAEQAKRARRAAKAGNTYGNPVTLKSKLLAAILSPLHSSREILVAEAAGTIRSVRPDDPALDEAEKAQKMPVTKLEEEGSKTGPSEMLTADEEAELAALMDDD